MHNPFAVVLVFVYKQINLLTSKASKVSSLSIFSPRRNGLPFIALGLQASHQHYSLVILHSYTSLCIKTITSVRYCLHHLLLGMTESMLDCGSHYYTSGSEMKFIYFFSVINFFLSSCFIFVFLIPVQVLNT